MIRTHDSVFLERDIRSTVTSVQGCAAPFTPQLWALPTCSKQNAR